MKIQSLLRLEILILLVAGCSTAPKKDTPHQRGWIGGTYESAKAKRSTADFLFGNDYDTVYNFPNSLHERKTGILALAVETNTPAYRAGLREGDLILEAGHQPMTGLPDFRRAIAESQPGAALPLKIYRDGKSSEFDVTVGREKFVHQGTITVGLLFLEPVHLIPTADTPKFSAGLIGWKRNPDAPLDFDSVEKRYKRSCHPKDKQFVYSEDWDFWMVCFRVSKSKQIQAQEIVVNP